MKDDSIRRCLPALPESSGVEVVTFGCRLNGFESEVIAGDECLTPHLSLQTGDDLILTMART
jgi:hypothetical protein